MQDAYVVELDIFHQLHCLNSLRKTLYPSRYHNDFGDYFTADGQRNYTGIKARHYGEPIAHFCHLRTQLSRIGRSLYRHNQRVSHVPRRHCYNLLAMDTLGSAAKTKIGSYPYLPEFRGDKGMGERA